MTYDGLVPSTPMQPYRQIRTVISINNSLVSQLGIPQSMAIQNVNMMIKHWIFGFKIIGGWGQYLSHMPTQQ